MMVSIRPFQESDITALLELNKTLVKNWYHFNSGKRGKITNYDKLTDVEKYIHGGPWLSENTITVHLKHHIRFGEILLMFDDEKLIAELEYHRVKTAIEYINGDFNAIYHLDWMMVHPDYQGKLLGTKLLEFAFKNFSNKNDGKVLILTESEPGVEEFYYKLNFDILKEKIYHHIVTGRGDNNWHRGSETLYTHIYGNFDVTDQYSMHLMETEQIYCEIFGKNEPISHIKLYEDIIAVKINSSVLENAAKILVSSKHKLEREKIIEILEKLAYITDHKEQLHVFLPFHLNSKNWVIVEENQKFIKILE